MSIGIGTKAIPLDGEYDGKKNMLRVKTSSARFHFGKKFGVTPKYQKDMNRVAPQSAMYEEGEYTYQQLREDKNTGLMKGNGFFLGNLGKGSEDSSGHNVAPALKRMGQTKYAYYQPARVKTSSHVKSFMK